MRKFEYGDDANEEVRFQKKTGYKIASFLCCPICDQRCKTKVGMFQHLKRIHSMNRDYINEYRKTIEHVLMEVTIKIGSTFGNALEKKYGERDNNKIKWIQDKRTATMIDRYGVSSALANKNIMKRKKKTCLENWGNEFPTKVELIKKRQLENMRAKNNGLLWCQTDNGYAAKFKYKNFTLPSGRMVKIQGYECHAIEMLFNEGVKEDNMLFATDKNFPKFWYFNKQRNGMSRYFPDIILKNEKKIVEVKSSYTLYLYPTLICDKLQTCIDAGYSIRVLVFTDDDHKNGTATMKLRNEFNSVEEISKYFARSSVPIIH